MVRLCGFSCLYHIILVYMQFVKVYVIFVRNKVSLSGWWQLVSICLFFNGEKMSTKFYSLFNFKVLRPSRLIAVIWNWTANDAPSESCLAEMQNFLPSHLAMYWKIVVRTIRLATCRLPTVRPQKLHRVKSRQVDT